MDSIFEIWIFFFPIYLGFGLNLPSFLEFGLITAITPLFNFLGKFSLLGKLQDWIFLAFLSLVYIQSQVLGFKVFP